jgi:hypothetical protein
MEDGSGKQTTTRTRACGFGAGAVEDAKRHSHSFVLLAASARSLNISD